MKSFIINIFLFSIILNFSSCFLDKNTVNISGVKGKKFYKKPNATISNVSIINNQLKIQGDNFYNIKTIKVKGSSGFNELFNIETKNDNIIVANSNKNISFLLNTAFELILSNAYGASSYQVNFTLQNDAVTTNKILDGSVTSSKLNSMGATAGKYLKWDGTSWVPSSIVPLAYQGLWKADGTGINLSAGGSPGDYYIINIGGITDPNTNAGGGVTWNIGDWVMWNDTLAQWDRVPSVMAPASGDLSGNYPNLTVNNNAITDVKINDVNISKITSAATKYFTYKPNNLACAGGEILEFDATPGVGWICGTKTSTSNVTATGATNSAALNLVSGTGDINLKTNSTSTKFTIKNSGNVGIGMVLPDTTLHINGSSNLTDLTQGKGDVSIGDFTTGVLRFDSNEIQSSAAGVATNLLLQKNGGNVGIGTSNPTSKFHIASGINTISTTLADTLGVQDNELQVEVKDPGISNGEVFKLRHQYFAAGANNTNGYLAFNRGGNSLNGSLSLGTNSGEKFRILDSGKIGVATTTPTSTLDVNGDIKSSKGIIRGAAANYNWTEYGWTQLNTNPVRWRKIAILPTSGSSTGDQVWLKLKIARHGGSNFASMDLRFGQRGTLNSSIENISGDLTLFPVAGIRCYQQGDGTTDVYAYQTANYSGLAIEMAAVGFATSATVISPADVLIQTTTPTGTLVFDSTTSYTSAKTSLNTNGNLGVGVSAPGTKLQVYTGNTSNANEGFSLIRGAGLDIFGFKHKSDGVGVYRGAITYNSIEAMTFLPSGNIGIGTTKPNSKLHTANGNVTAINQIYYPLRVSPQSGTGGFSNNGAGILFDSWTNNSKAENVASVSSGLTTGGTGGGATNFSGHLILGTKDTADTAPVERVRVTPNGNVGIGTSNPGAKLEVNGALIEGQGFGTITHNVVSYFTAVNNSTDYIHLKLPYNTTIHSSMFHIKVTGYAYGAVKPVDLTFVGYCYQPLNSIVNASVLDPTASMAPAIYKGSDNFVYLRFKPTSVYYLTFRVDSMYVGNGTIMKKGDIMVVQSAGPTL